MDMSLVPVIFIVLFLVSCVALFLVYKYGINEKSYEEALAEQKQYTQALLSNKAKPKDKKNKKAAKKMKEKDKHEEEQIKNAETKEDEPTEVPRPATPKLHVEFKNEPEELTKEPATAGKKKSKKELHPILLNKDDENVVDTEIEDIPPANHFEEIHPKDDFELLRSNSREELLKPGKEKSKLKQISESEQKKKDESVKQSSGKDKNKTKEQPNNERTKKKAKSSGAEQPVIEKEETKVAKPSTIEEDKGKEAKLATTDKEKEKEVKSSNEKERLKDARPSLFEKEKQKDVKLAYSEKDKQKDVKPVSAEKEKQKEVKSVSEKEKQKEVKPVSSEKEKAKELKPPSIVSVAPQTNGVVNNPGKEKKKKRGEFNLHQLAVDRDAANMPLIENLVRKAELSRSDVQILIDLLLNKLQDTPAMMDDWSEGKSDPVQKLKKQLAEKERALIEEQEALVGAQAKLREIRSEQLAERSQLQHKIHGLEELLQNKQMELQGLNNRCHGQTQQYQQLQAQVNEERAAMQMQIQQYEIRLAQTQEAEGIMAQLRADLQGLSEQNQQMRLELQRLAEEKEHHQGVIMQLNNFQDELKQKADLIRHLESNLEIARRKEGDCDVEITRLESICQQNLKEIRDLEVGKNHAVEEARNIKNQKEEMDAYINQLKTDLQKLKREKALIEDEQANGNIDENQSQKVEILNLTNELTSVRNELQHTERKYKSELDATMDVVKQLEIELDEQKSKNNELRTRNWKVMEALNAAENRIKNYCSKTEMKVEKSSPENQAKDLESQKEFIVRLFPEINEIQSLKVSSENWQVECSKYIKDYIANLKKQQKELQSKTSSEDLGKLKQENKYYRSVIDETEQRLNQLQCRVEQEEMRWRKQLEVREEQYKKLEACENQLREQVERLEKDLDELQVAKEKLEDECHLLKSRAISDPSVICDEVSELQAKNSDVYYSCPKSINNCNSTNGPSHIQRRLSSSSSNASSLMEVTVRKPKNKKKKKKEPAKLED